MKTYLLGLNNSLTAIVVVSSILTMTGCGISQVKSETRLAQNNSQAKLIAEQNALLAQQAERLNELTESQTVLLKQVDNLQKEVRRAAVSAHRNASKQKSQKVADRKAIVKAKSVPPAGKIVVGRNEWVWFDVLNGLQKARVDTGARSSSLSAENIQPFERDGKKWVRFNVPGHPANRVIETPLVRYTKIKQASMEGKERRPVVRLTIRLGNLVEESEFTLTNRNKMLYPVLLGRSFLQDIAVVDVALKFTQSKWSENSPKVSAK